MEKSSTDRTSVIYEHPLNERIRTLLRLEFLFDQGEFGAEGETPFHSRIAIGTLVDIVSLLSRGDLRSEIQKELERVVATLETLQQRQGVDAARLGSVLDECRSVTDKLRASPPGIPREIRDNEFLNSIAQRAGILGGTCGFDVPSYHLWLHAPAEQRRADLLRWFDGFRYLKHASRLLLRLLRDSAGPSPEVAAGAVFQANFERNNRYQLLRVAVPAGTDCFPEISGNRHFCTIRFMRQPDPCERPQQADEDVHFELTRCVV